MTPEELLTAQLVFTTNFGADALNFLLGALTALAFAIAASQRW